VWNVTITVIGAHPVSYTVTLFPRVKLTVHLHLMTEVKNAWRYTCTHIRLHGVVCLVMRRDITYLLPLKCDINNVGAPG